ncbi:hypothetical protein [Streptomyces sp. NPDC089799]|uniref:hypothetical protein n=1 Tax=Streptomyces sp. NPDC089799 TaxID=3155066 RepID=UPI0034175EDE
MQKHTVSAESAATSATASTPSAEDGMGAGRITLSGRNKMCARARALSGMVLASGIVISLGQLDTSVSFIKASA